MQKLSEDAPLLVAQTGPLDGQRWVIKHKLYIGREPTCDIVIPNRQVSRRHAILIPTSNGVIVEDLDSKNGLHLNGKKVQNTVSMQDGDTLQIALIQQFLFLSSDATLPLDSYDFEILPQENHLLRLEKRSRRVWIGTQEILPPLSVSQFILLELLYEHQERVVSRKDLIINVWGEEQALMISDQALDALVRRLRDRLRESQSDHSFIVTIRGHGLRLDNPLIE